MSEPVMSEGAHTYTCAILSGATVEEARVMARGDDIFVWYREELEDAREEVAELEAKVKTLKWEQDTYCDDCSDKDTQLEAQEDEIASLEDRIRDLEAALAAKGAA